MTLRRPGGRWWLLAHEWAGRQPGEREGGYSISHHVSNDPAAPAKHAATARELARLSGRPQEDHTRVHVLPASCEFDELVVSQWLHVEQMDTGTWWMAVGGVVLWVTVDRDGRPKRVDVYGPGKYDAPVPGCEYSFAWTETEVAP